MAKGKKKVEVVVDEAAKEELREKVAAAKAEMNPEDLGPLKTSRMCPNCRYRHILYHNEDGTKIIITLGGSRIEMLTTNPEYPCPKCGLRLEMKRKQNVR